jgi:hypothetical protein
MERDKMAKHQTWELTDGYGMGFNLLTSAAGALFSAIIFSELMNHNLKWTGIVLQDATILGAYGVFLLAIKSLGQVWEGRPFSLLMVHIGDDLLIGFVPVVMVYAEQALSGAVNINPTTVAI